MVNVKRVRRPSRGARVLRSGRSPFRLVAACSIGLVLMGAAFEASFATSRQDRPRAQVGPTPSYDEGGGGLGVGGIAAIAVVGGAAIAGILGLFGAGAVAGVFPLGAPHDCRDRYPILPEEHRSISEIRLHPQSSTLEQGYCRCFYLEVRSGVDSKWYSVTNRAESTLDLREPSMCVTKLDGSKNIFCVPMSAPQTCNGQSVVVEGRFAPTWMPAATAEARILVKVPGDRRFTTPGGPTTQP